MSSTDRETHSAVSALSESCKTDCPSANRVCRLLAHNRCDRLCVTVARIRSTALLPTETAEGYKGKQSEAVAGCTHFGSSTRAGRASTTHMQRPGLAFNVWLNKHSGGTRPCCAAVCGKRRKSSLEKAGTRQLEMNQCPSFQPLTCLAWKEFDG